MNSNIETKEVEPQKLKRRLIFSSATGIVFFAALIAAFNYISDDSSAEDASAVTRAFFHLNEKVFSTLQSPTRLSVEKPKPANGKKPRINGDEGLQTELILENYLIDVTSGLQELHLTPSEIQKQPSVTVSTDFKCIEGWSSVIHYKGLRFSDFMDIYKMGKKSDGSYYKYVALETPDGEYYVSIDMKSMLHPQTVLAYEMNEAPLSIQNGAPLRLIIPIKYGIKSIKRIGRIYFTDERAQDFWTEQGYDWYSGL